MVKVAGNEGFEIGKGYFAGALSKGLMVKHLTINDEIDCDRNLRDMGVIDGLDGLNLNSSSMNDAFWHIKTGEWIVQHGMVKNCIGSWIIGDKPWMAHEWLFGVLIYLVSCMGMRWIVIGCHLLYLIVVYLCCKQAGLFRKNQNPPALYWMLVLLPQFAVYANMTVARPQYGG